MRIRDRIARGFRSRRGEEGGFFLVFFAIILTVLLGFAGFAVDFASWSYEGQQQQKAADAAALAGSVYMPDNFGVAKTTALQVAAANGYTSGVDVEPGTRPSQLKVSITKTVDTIFARAVGVDTKTISRTATAEYSKPIAMGSPTNQYGNDPEAGSVTNDTFPNFWGSIAGSGTDKANGDAYQADVCSSGTDGCSGGNNSDYDSNGYFYTVHFNQSATVNLQIFDPGVVKVGQNCDWSTANLSQAQTLLTSRNPIFPLPYVRGWPNGASPGPNTRYAPWNPNNANDPAAKWCTGDDDYGSGDAPSVSYQVFGPANVPGEPASAQPATTCSSKWTFPGYNGDVYSKLQSDTKMAVTPQPQFLGSYFRQWWTLCSGLTGSAGQDYFIQIKSGSGNGRNSFAIRAQNGSNAVSVYGNAKMSMSANVSGTATNFYLARLMPNAAGHNLVLNFFDIGDGNGAVGSLQVKPPTDSGLGSFSNCSYIKPGTSSPATLSSCTITSVTSSVYNGKWVRVIIPIPSTYTCAMTDPRGCWTTINYSFNNVLHDVTSWNAYVDGDPVRLVH